MLDLPPAGNGSSLLGTIADAWQVPLTDVGFEGSARYEGRRIIVIFEGRDAAGKGGAIKAITERVSPRVFPSCRLAGAIGPRENAAWWLTFWPSNTRDWQTDVELCRGKNHWDPLDVLFRPPHC